MLTDRMDPLPTKDSRLVRRALLLLLCIAVLGIANPPPLPADEAIDFLTQVKPILQAHCFKCHGADKQESGLRLDVRSAAFQGGDSYAPVIRPRRSSDSPLLQFVSRDDAPLKMPPEGARLSPAEVEIIRRWIDQGANWPEGDTSSGDRWARHWAFQPVRRLTIPISYANSEFAFYNPIDLFIREKLAVNGLSPSPAAQRRTLIRRLYFDLLGLPPSPEEVIDFERDSNPQAYEKLVDRLLASPHYGERWARHWLDVVRFAESHGFEMNQPRPNAWRYRDYVIQSFNADKPYNQFVREQIVGDLWGIDEATSFLVGGPWDQVKSPDPVLTAQQRADELHDMVSTTGSTFLGLTIGCARCHTHKFDPVSHAEYYAIKACLEGVQHGQRELRSASPTERAAQLVEAERLRGQLADLESQVHPAPVNARLNVERFSPVAAKKIRFTIRATSNLEPCLDELEAWTAGSEPRNAALAGAGAKATASGVFPNSDLHRIEHINDGRYGNGRSWISNEPGKGWIEIEFAKLERIDRVLWGRDRDQKLSDRLPTDYSIEVSDGGPWLVVASAQDHAEPAARVAQRKDLEQRISQLLAGPLVYAGTFVQPGPTLRFHRGDPTQAREPIAPAALAYFGQTFQLAPDAPEQERRAALANWITDPRNPLTARVLVNRIWQYHFGEGLVSTPSDFGMNGGKPSHPELLDWLASEFLEPSADPRAPRWSMKYIHRLICTSATYRQDSSIADSRPPITNSNLPNNPQSKWKIQMENPQLVDSACRFLWRYPPRRLEAEPLRDAILAVSGQLDLRMGGPGFDLFEPNTNYVKVYVAKREFGREEFRRMVYQAKPRMQLEDTFGAFDCPDAGQIAPRRSSSTTPLQALNLLNSPFLVQQADFFARRLVDEAGPDPAHQVERAFQLAFSRSPTKEESEAAIALIARHGLPSLCRALFNANEFIRVD